jgi:mannose-6-phosphate isomerase-like protein (cupin superfamily)
LADGVSDADPSSDGYAVVDPNQVENFHDGTDIPGEFRQLTEALGARQLAVTFVRVPAHTDFERGTGHIHEEIEELYLVTRGTLTMRCGEDVLSLRAPAAVRVDPQTPRSHRNEGDEPVEMWAVSRWMERSDSTKIDDFWDASPEAGRHA